MEPVRNQEKIYGTTLYIGELDLELHVGQFRAFVYQDLIHKGYIIALTMGLDSPDVPLYSRIHSSCVTSETLRSMDCDCVHQLEGALEKIAEKKHGVLFYLIQEGRGCGYVGKSRACMLVQYKQDTISTFDAYRSLGMKDDYRDYRNIKDVAHLLKIENHSYTLLTNNPDKIKGFQNIGLSLKSVESIEITPNPFSQSYLISKEQMGHILYKTKTKVQKYNSSFSEIEPFTPYELPDCSRFIHCSSYYIPVKPVNHQVELKQEEASKMEPWLLAQTNLPNGNVLAQVQEEMLPEVGSRPYWFKVNMYYDIASTSDYVVLTYGDIKNREPAVRIHSESLFNRFPLKTINYREKYKKSVEEIVKHQSGIIVLLYHDGRGAGLGNYILNQSNAKTPTGIKLDSRDYDAVSLLLKHHLGNQSIRMLFSHSSRLKLEESFRKRGIQVSSWTPLTTRDDEKGHTIISQRITDAPYHLLDMPIQKLEFSDSKKLHRHRYWIFRDSRSLYDASRKKKSP